MNFFESVYEVVKKIPKGKVMSYGQVAREAGNAKMSRQVGWALHVNPCQSEIPCHRVVFKNGSVCEGFAFGGKSEQIRLLKNEGVNFDDSLRVRAEYFLLNDALPETTPCFK